ncbi:MAG: hypothetical protein IT514_05465 [Burkholderiales bacterium]|nr:hypothetical protein [Burkholderiales bacterium]
MWGYWKPYVPVARRRAQAQQAAAKAKKAGQDMHPVVIEGRAIARTFWGQAWCDNLEAYSDFENRLPRGRAYVRNGSVIDLKIEPGKVKARVMGSSLYRIEIGIAAVPNAHWKSLAKECAGSIASLVELLQGKLSKAVMQRICQPKTGLFPAPKDIRLDCSCPDWATMCKHVAAVLYGVGARLDTQPELLFTLRQVDAGDLVTQAAELPVKAKKAPPKAKVLDEALLSDVFGIEMALPDALARETATRRARRAAAPAPQAKRPAKKKAAAVPAMESKPAKKSAAKRKDRQASPKPAPRAAKGRNKPRPV